MSEEIVLYTNPMSRGRIAHLMLEELGRPYKTELLDLDRGDHKRPEFLAVNPMGKVPTIVHRGVVVTEAAAICAYLADTFPEAKLAPEASDPRRGSYLRWLFFTASNFEAALADHAFPRTKSPGPRSLGYGSYEDVLNTLERALAPGPYLLGAFFTAADVYVGSQIGWALYIKAIEPRPVFESYAERIALRLAAQSVEAQCSRMIERLNAQQQAAPGAWPAAQREQKPS